jgi:hypothetical protein
MKSKIQMGKKKYIKQLISIKFTDRENAIDGYVVDYNEDWILMKNNPVDYLIDGYIVVRNTNIESFNRDTDEKWKEKVIKLKGLEPTENDIIPISDLETILKYLTENFGIFQIQTKSESECFLGRLKSIDSKKVIIDDLNTKGNWDGEMTFVTSEIRTIEFDTDYVNSLKLVLES